MKTNLIEYFLDTVEKFPNKVAIRSDDDKNIFTFKELYLRSYFVAKQIVKKNTFQEPVPIIIVCEKSANSVIYILASLISGNIYCPIDVSAPISRIKKIVESLGKSIILIENSSSNTLDEDQLKKITNKLSNKLISVSFQNYKPLESNNISNDIESWTKNIIDTDPCYILFTSGSTGIPKGVTISHRSVIDYILWAINAYNITEEEIIGNQAPFFFDNSTLDIYLSFFTAAELVVIPDKYFIFPKTLIDFLNKSKINFIFWVPTLLINIANLKLLDSEIIPNLKKILFAGEVMPSKHLQYWQRRHPKALYSNLYGPTEITVDCTFFIVPNNWKGETVPIGLPCKNSNIIILDEKDKASNRGELCVRGSSLSLGYWNNWDQTNKVFIQNPLNKKFIDLIYRTGDLVSKDKNGQIYFIGRIDNQIKISGYRIELGEIEEAISNIKLIAKSVVVFFEDRKELILAYETTHLKEISNSDLIGSLLKSIPKYMIPKKFVHFKNLPILSNGKINRVKIKRILESYEK